MWSRHVPFTTSSAAWLLPVTPNALPPAAPEHPLDSYETEIRALCVTVLVCTERIVWSEARSQPTCKIRSRVSSQLDISKNPTIFLSSQSFASRIVFVDKWWKLSLIYVYIYRLVIGKWSDNCKQVDVYTSLFNRDIKYYDEKTLRVFEIYIFWYSFVYLFLMKLEF